MSGEARSPRPPWLKGSPLVVCILGILVLCTIVVMPVPAHAQTPGLSIQNGRVIDANGYELVMRGINHPHAWFPTRLAAIADIKATGANTVRVVLSTGDRFRRTDRDEVVAIVESCETNRVVCVLEVHDTTGFPEVQGSISLDAAVDYWVAMADVLSGRETNVVLNIGNEPFGNEGYLDWTDASTRAVTRMRAAGFRHLLMVDAPNWGQDWSMTMSDSAAVVASADPLQNLMFDVHMYGVFETETSVRTYLEAFVAQELALVVGEFGPRHTDGDPNEDAILEWTQAYELGYIAWSWSGNRSPVEYLNVVEDFDPARRTSWGERLINGDHGIATTSQELSVAGERRVSSAPPMRSAPPTVAAQPLALDRVPSLVVDRAEAESGVGNGVRVSLQGAGFSGTGYVQGFDVSTDSLTVTLYVERAGEYDLAIGYRAAYGDKTQRLYVNGLYGRDVRFPATRDFATTTVERVVLQQGANTIMIAHDWGWFDLDYIEVRRPG